MIRSAIWRTSLGHGLLFWALALTAAPSPTNGESVAAGGGQPLRIYIDASRSGGSAAAGIAIERGVRTALAEVDNEIADWPVEIVLKDHRGNSRRSRLHLEQFLEDDRGLLVVGGLHSPPILAARDFIQENEILLLDPWAAAGPITRGPYRPSWIFRLSVDDTLAGEAIARFALDLEGARSPALVVEETGWGRSNLRTMRAALKKRDLRPAGIWRFRWGLGKVEAAQIAGEIRQSGADVVFMVANSEEGKVLTRAIATLPEAPPIRSHWGIAGGSFSETVTSEVREKVRLVFLQTNFSFLDEELPPLAKTALASARAVFPEVSSAEEIRSPSGFIHGYDLTRLLIAATRNLELSAEIREARRQVRDALESIDEPVQGLVRNYQRPFRPMTGDDTRDHEALGIDDLRMGRFDERGNIRLIDDRQMPARNQK